MNLGEKDEKAASKEKSGLLQGSGNGNGNGHGHKVSMERHNSMIDPDKIRYGFGIHVGRDGLEHLGIDRCRRGGERSGRELVIFEEQRGMGGGGDA